MVPEHKLDLSKPGMPSRRLPDEPNHVAHDYNPDDRALFQEILRLNPKAVVLRSIPKMNDEVTDSASEDEQSYTFLRQVKCLFPLLNISSTELAYNSYVS